MSEYPINSTAKVYQDIDGNDVSLYQLIRREPDWAHSRIKRCEELEAQQQWVSVEERLPEENEHVIASCGDYPNTPVCASILIEGRWFDQDVVESGGEWPELHLVTHWMPLPAPPEQEGEKG